MARFMYIYIYVAIIKCVAQSGCGSSAAKADPHLSLLHRLHILNPSQELQIVQPPFPPCP